MTFADEVTTDTPHIWWDTRQAIGSSQPDASGNGHTGTLVGSPTLNASNGITFDNTPTGNDQWIAGNDTFGPGNTATFAFEVVLNATSVANGPSILLWDDSPAEVGFSGFYADTIGQAYINWRTPAPSFVSVSQSGLTTGALHHLVGEWDGTNGNLYIDGTLVNTATGGSYDQLSFSIPETFVLANDLGGFTDGFTGLIRHGIFYSHSLGATRVAAHATAALANDPPPGGVTLTVDYQFALGATIYGPGTDISIEDAR